MRRFYLPAPCVPTNSQNLIELEGQQARHMALVLRLKAGEKVEFFDGCGQVFSTRLLAVEQGRVSALVEERCQETTPRHPQLVLAQALLRGKKMDLVVQKANELGVHAFVPLLTRFCENRSGGQAAAERWQRIVIESCKQCRRAIPMHIEHQALQQLTSMDFSWAGLRLVAWEGEQRAGLPPALEGLRVHSGPICLLIGPEGGLHQDELAWLKAQGFHSFSLGVHILRAETAAIAGIAIVQHLSGALQPQM